MFSSVDGEKLKSSVQISVGSSMMPEQHGDSLMGNWIGMHRTRRPVGLVPGTIASHYTEAKLSVLVAIADVAKREGECRLSRSGIANLARCSRTTVADALSLAKSCGHVSMNGKAIKIDFDEWRAAEGAATMP
jgi:hypothetical protein